MVSGRSLELFALAALPLVFFPGPSVAFIVTSTLRHGTGFGVRGTQVSRSAIWCMSSRRSLVTERHID
jgi:hypothetical protein